MRTVQASVSFDSVALQRAKEQPSLLLSALELLFQALATIAAPAFQRPEDLPGLPRYRDPRQQPATLFSCHVFFLVLAFLLLLQRNHPASTQFPEGTLQKN